MEALEFLAGRAGEFALILEQSGVGKQLVEFL